MAANIKFIVLHPRRVNNLQCSGNFLEKIRFSSKKSKFFLNDFYIELDLVGFHQDDENHPDWPLYAILNYIRFHAGDENHNPA